MAFCSRHGLIDPASERVVYAVAEQTNTDPLELPRLFDAIDPEALDAVIRDLEDGKVQFPYADYMVTVASDGAVDVAPRSGVGSQSGPVEADGRERTQD